MTGDELDGRMLGHLCWNSTGKLIAAAMDNMVNVWFVAGGRGHLDVQPHWVTALAWPQNKVIGGSLGLSIDSLLIGRLDGSLALITVIDSSTFRRVELEHCGRKDGQFRQNTVIILRLG